MTRTIANALLVAVLACAAPAYSSNDGFVKVKHVDRVATSSKPAAERAAKPAAQKPRAAPRDVNGNLTGNAKKKGHVDYGWKVEEAGE